MRILSTLKLSRKETFVRMIDEQFNETMGIRFKTLSMSNQVSILLTKTMGIRFKNSVHVKPGEYTSHKNNGYTL